MRALGPGSVSSFLKMALDVVHVLLWFLLIVMVLVLLGTIVLQPFIASQVALDGDFSVSGETDPERVRQFIRSPIIPGILAAVSVYVGGLVYIVGRLRRVFVTLTQGDPFQPLNVQRLRVIGFTLAALEIFSYLVRGVLTWWEARTDMDMEVGIGESFDLTIWFAVLVVFVLAEVFREGARLRREAELTI
jgi:magnesium-transporting ATPase (P-type)